MVLKDELARLVELQTIDVQIYKFAQDKNVEIPALLKTLESEFETKKKSLKDATEAVQQAQLKKKSKELDLSAKEESIQKAQAALNMLKTNKEYQAKMNEIASLKGDVSILDEEVLKSMDAIEASEKIKKEAADLLATEEKKFNEQVNALNVRRNECDFQIKVLDDKRIVISRDVDKKILAVYDKLLKSRSGVAIAAINGSSCGACYMNLTAQTINEAKMYRDLVLCQSCNRILYIVEDPQ